MIHPIVAEKLPQLRELCKKYRVERMYLFGSATTDAFNDQSDLDFLILFDEKLPPEISGENYFELHYALDVLFRRDIDLLTEPSLRNPYFAAEVNQTKRLLYAT